MSAGKKFKKRKLKETTLKGTIKDDLPKAAWSYAPVQMGMGSSGIPDIIACVPVVIKQEDVGKTFGHFVGIEAKIKPNTPTALQQEQLEGISKAGGTALIITGERGKPYITKKVKVK